MPTFQTLQDRVERRIIDLPSSVTTEVPDLINKAMRTLQDMHNFKVMEAETGRITTTASARTLSTVPTTFKAPRGLPYLVRDDGSTRDLLLAPHRAAVLDIYTLDDVNETGEPRLLLHDEASDQAGTSTWEVYPYSDGNSDYSNGQYRVIIPYWRWLTELSDGTDENWFTTNAEWFLVFLATAEGFYLDWDPAQAQMWEARAGLFSPDGRSVGEFGRVIRTDKMARLGSVRQLAIHRDVWAPQLRR